MIPKKDRKRKGLSGLKHRLMRQLSRTYKIPMRWIRRHNEPQQFFTLSNLTINGRPIEAIDISKVTY